MSEKIIYVSPKERTICLSTTDLRVLVPGLFDLLNKILSYSLLYTN